MVQELWWGENKHEYISWSEKAFNTVDHNIILSKLREYGAEGTSHSWFTSYLTNREQFCYFNGSSSSKSRIKYGIPQGSCLGPLLFILCINNFENCPESMKPNMHTNDTCVNIASENLTELLTDLKNELEIYLIGWGLINFLWMPAKVSIWLWAISDNWIGWMIICQTLSSIMKLSKESTRQNI